MNELTVIEPAGPVQTATAQRSLTVPAIVADAGAHAARRFLEFFAATIRNKNTRTAYHHAVLRFFDWCDRTKLGRLEGIEPLHVGAAKLPC